MYNYISFLECLCNNIFFVKICILLMKVWFQTSLQLREEKCVLLSCYAAGSDNFLPTFQEKLSVPSSRFKKPTIVGFMTLEDVTDRLS